MPVRRRGGKPVTELQYVRRIRATSLINGLLGISLILTSCWLGVFATLFALTTLIVGIIVLLGSSLRFSFKGTRAFSWLNALSGAWLIVAPQVLPDGADGIGAWVSIFSGILIAGIACLSLTFSGIARAWTLPRPELPFSSNDRR